MEKGNQNKIEKDIQTVNERMNEITIDSIYAADAVWSLYENSKDEKYLEKIKSLFDYITKNITSDELLTDKASLAWIPFYVWYDTNYNKKENYLLIMDIIKKLNSRYPDSLDITEMLDKVQTVIAEEIYEYYNSIKVMRKQRSQSRLQFKVVFVSTRTAVIEVLNQGYYNTKEEYKLYVNDTFYCTSNKVVQAIYGLSPDMCYHIRIKNRSTVSDEVRITTANEFVTLNVREFGAKGDGISDDTTFLQCAINCCPKNGRVLVPEGVYKISSLYLKSDLKLELAKGAVLSAFTDRRKFPILPGVIESNDGKEEYNIGTWEGNPLNCFAGIITGINVSNVEITGEGTIDGCASKENWWKNPKIKNIAWRPRLIFLNHCDHITIQGITVQNSPSWNIHPYFSDDLRFIGLTIINPKDSSNTDGLDPESCRNVEILGTYFSVGDDCIAIKSGKIYMGAKHKRASENLTIRQCCMRDGHGSVTIGSEMAGGVKNLKVSECLFLHTDRGLRIKTRRGRGKDAIVDNILFDNIIMDHVMTPIVINCFYFCDPDGHSAYVQSKDYYPVDDRTPYIGELTFSNLNCTNCHAAAAYMYGLPEQKIKKVTFEQITISYAKEPHPIQPAMMDGVDKTTLLGLFANNIETLELKNVKISGNQGDAFLIQNVDHLIKE